MLIGVTVAMLVLSTQAASGSAPHPLSGAAASATFSGVLRGGSAAANHYVQLRGSGGVLAAQGSTGADGSFSVQVAPGIYGLQVTGDDFNVLGLQVDLSHGDVNQDLTLPALAQMRVTVLDSGGSPVANASVSEGSGATGTAALWPGGPLATVDSYESGVCDTDASGVCSYTTFIGAEAKSIEIDIPNGPTVYPTTPAVTTDPTTLTVQLSNYAVVQSKGAIPGVVSVATSHGRFSNVSNTAVASSPPPGAVVLTGALSYTVNGLQPGDTADVTLHLPSGSNPTSVVKRQNGSYVDLSSIASITGNTIVLHLKDGGLGDADGIANGAIVDPLVPIRPGASISSFMPSSGPVGTVVTITGSRFTGATAVKFNGVKAASYTVVSGTTVKATVAAGTTSGKITITTPSGTATSATAFTVVVPTISTFTPSSGPVGTVVTITGSRFTGATAVKFNGVKAASYSVVSGTAIKATVAAGTTSGKITITTPSGTATSATAFTVVPKISAFTPSSGWVGTVVTITGSGFTGATAVKFNGTKATSYTVISSTKIKATIAARTTSGKITITTPGGTATSANKFAVK